MISFTSDDADMATRSSEVMEDFLHDMRSTTQAELDAAKKLGKLRRGLLVTGDSQTEAEAELLLREVVVTELAHWIPGNSQRLINRASLVLVGAPILDPIMADDHGASPANHTLFQDWVCGIYVLRCTTCARLFKV